MSLSTGQRERGGLAPVPSPQATQMSFLVAMNFCPYHPTTSMKIAISYTIYMTEMIIYFGTHNYAGIRSKPKQAKPWPTGPRTSDPGTSGLPHAPAEMTPRNRCGWHGNEMFSPKGICWLKKNEDWGLGSLARNKGQFVQGSSTRLQAHIILHRM